MKFCLLLSFFRLDSSLGDAHDFETKIDCQDI